MKPSLWAEIHRLSEIEKLSQRQIAAQLHCGRKTVRTALSMKNPPAQTRPHKGSSKLDPYKPKLEQMVNDYPRISAARLYEEVKLAGYGGSISLVRKYLHLIRPLRKRVYLEVTWLPGDAIQVDWGDCGYITIGSTRRRVSVFVAVLCYSRMLFVAFTLDQKKETFYRCIVRALTYFGGSPRRIIVDNLKAAVVDGHGRNARFHPEFTALCAHYRMQQVACQRRDPESKGMVEDGVRYVKHNALAGRLLETWDDYQALESRWLTDVANVRIHRTTGERPVDQLAKEELRQLPQVPYDTDEVRQAVVNSHSRITFDGNRYSVDPDAIRKSVTIRANDEQVRVILFDREVALHRRSHERHQLIIDNQHQLAAIARRRRETLSVIEARWDCLGEIARDFRKGLAREPVKATIHLRRIIKMTTLYGKAEVMAALIQACEYQVFDAAYVENLIEQNRRKRHLPSPLTLNLIRKELLDEIILQEPDPGDYDKLITGEQQ